jgi:hypothetical protein
VTYEESVSYFKRLENLEKIRRTSGPGPATLPVDNKKSTSVTSGLGKSSKNPMVSNAWCHYCAKNSHNKANCSVVAKFKQQKKACFETKAEPGRKSLAFLFVEINALNIQFKPEKTASSKKRNAEPFLYFSPEIYSNNSMDEVHMS